MAQKLPSKAYSSSSLMEGAKVLAHQQVKMEPDSDAMESELKDPVSHVGQCNSRVESQDISSFSLILLKMDPMTIDPFFIVSIDDLNLYGTHQV